MGRFMALARKEVFGTMSGPWQLSRCDACALWQRLPFKGSVCVIYVQRVRIQLPPESSVAPPSRPMYCV